MDKKGRMILIFAFATLSVLVLSVPATYLWGENVGAILRWVGVGMGVVYFVVRSRYRKGK